MYQHLLVKLCLLLPLLSADVGAQTSHRYPFFLFKLVFVDLS